MDPKVVLVLLLLVLIVVGVNGLLIIGVRKKQPIRWFSMWQKAASRARSPWKEENKQMEELAELVKALKESEAKEGEE